MEAALVKVLGGMPRRVPHIPRDGGTLGGGTAMILAEFTALLAD